MVEKVLVGFKKSDLVWLRKEAKENNRDASDMCQQLIHLHALELFDYKYKFRESVSLRWLEKFCWENNHPVEWDGTDDKRHEVDAVQVKDLLKAARKEADLGEKTKK